MGRCGEGSQLRVAHVGPHFGEEPPITGQRGSGTVFFSGCSLKCSYCQNFQISHLGLGRSLSPGDLTGLIVGMIRRDRVHNVNFVTPDHFFPHVFEIVSRLRERGLDLPVVFNLSGYQALEWLERASNHADIYLPDFKYAEQGLASALSTCRDYPGVALQAIAAMVRQKGFLDACGDRKPLATKGVLVRHLILPGHVENSLTALTCLFVEFGSHLPLSLMSQYHPVRHQKDAPLNRFLKEEEFRQVYDHALDLGFETIYVQFPERDGRESAGSADFLPDFERAEPFKGNEGG